MFRCRKTAGRILTALQEGLARLFPDEYAAANPTYAGTDIINIWPVAQTSQVATRSALEHADFTSTTLKKHVITETVLTTS